MDQLNLHLANGLELHSMNPMERMMVRLEVFDILTVKRSMVSQLQQLYLKLITRNKFSQRDQHVEKLKQIAP